MNHIQITLLAECSLMNVYILIFVKLILRRK